ncbi:hypothetical protein [Frigoriflavimonas asaccharolytica]|uniref:Uncharacterized protein n=1 Tax=Frigoriflavimonas asaccharolytica TaxID=2735899 RepID=A0A8J8K8L9_9FLAO|nr:hypothetical protein [Frigoriflavimonas asaccharolytica]NRS92776.1 hypothetical protein [Frigoriflavimonas asaccharolytica]
MIIYKIISKKTLAITSEFSTEKELKGNLEDNMLIIENALQQANFKNIKFDNVTKIFHAKANFSIWSFAENIEIKIVEKENSIVLNFKSICVLPTQIIDYEKNKTNFKKFERVLKLAI